MSQFEEQGWNHKRGFDSQKPPNEKKEKISMFLYIIRGSVIVPREGT